MGVQILDYHVALLLQQLKAEGVVLTSLTEQLIYNIDKRLPEYEECSNITLKKEK